MLKIIGDINFCDGYFDLGIGTGTAIANGQDPFIHLDIKLEDFWIGNFECVCARSNDKYEPFVISPNALKHVKHLGLYGISNNHVMQHGKGKYDEMTEYLSSNYINYAGSNERRSTTFRHQNKKVGFLSFSMRPDNFSKNPSYWHLPDLCEIKYEIERLSDCDYRIAFVHWGYEFINYPNIGQKQLAHWLVDSGIDLVAGMHPHVAQGIEVYNGKQIYYSLGNAVFNMPWEPTQYGLMINVDLGQKQPVVSTSYIHIGDDHFPAIVSSVPKEYSLEYLNSLLAINKEDEIYFSKARERYLSYRKANRMWILCNMFKLSSSARSYIISNFIKRRF